MSGVEKVAIVGAGLIGRSWAIVFARAGIAAHVVDAHPAAEAAARTEIDAALADLAAAGLIADADAVRARITLGGGLAAALDGAGHVQECGPEQVEAKRALFAQIEALAAPDAVLASSTSGIVASRFANHLATRGRCLVAHPVNPPHLVPLVEVAPAPFTDPAAVERTMALMRAAAQAPILVRREVDGFVLNRLQGALLTEALRLHAAGVVDAEGIDLAMTEGLGMRWAFAGPMETIDLNAPGGLADYVARYGAMYAAMQAAPVGPDPWTAETAARLDAEMRARRPADALPARRRWRDRRMAALAARKRA
ncbi:MAG: 3-hydroxyacyl-CoA dehydrogenase, partial [Rubrimonas sp.]